MCCHPPIFATVPSKLYRQSPFDETDKIPFQSAKFFVRFASARYISDLRCSRWLHRLAFCIDMELPIYSIEIEAECADICKQITQSTLTVLRKKRILQTRKRKFPFIGAILRPFWCGYTIFVSPHKKILTVIHGSRDHFQGRGRSHFDRKSHRIFCDGFRKDIPLQGQCRKSGR